MAYPGLAREEHKYLGKEYCTGYTDVDGKWNTGFYCPQYGSKTAVFCCGTAVFKYCCTNQEPVDSIAGGGGGSLLDGDDPNFGGDGVSSAVFVRVPIVFGVVCGIAAVLILLVVAACYFCSCCFAYKKRRDDPRDHHRLPTSLYRASNSTTSNLLNLYSPAALTANSLVTTPLDLDWALAHASGPSSLSSSYQSQQFYPNLFQNPALAAAALSQRSSHSPSPSSLLYSSAGGGQSTPSVISGNTINNRYPPQSALSAYHNFLNSSTSTLSSRGGVIAPPAPPPTSAGLHRGNLPQQISTTASIVNSYLASLQQAQAHNQIQGHSEPPPQPSSQPQQVQQILESSNQSVDHPRHPSPPPPYSQIGPPYQNGNGNRSNNRNNGSNNQPSNRALMATIQSVLGRGSGPGGGGPGTGTATISGNCSSEDELANFLLRNEDYLRRALRLGVPNNNNNNTANNRNINNNTATNNQNNTSNNNANNANSRTNPSNASRGSSTPMLTQRELIELLLRLTYSDPPRSSSGGGSVSRSESRAGSDSAISVTSRSTTSSAKSGGTSGSTAASSGVKIPSTTKLTICEVDEEDERLGMMNGKSSDPTRLDLTLSRISDNDSGVPSSGSCSTTGSEASAVIGSIKVFSRDMSEEAVKLKKQHALDDDGDHHHHHHHHPHHRHPFPSSCDPPEEDHHDDDLVGNKKLLHQQQLAAIHPETNCTSNAATNNNAFSGIKRSDGLGGSGSSDGEVIIESSSSHSPSSTTLLESSDDQQSNGESVSSKSESPPTVPRSLSVAIVPCENAISSTAQVTQ